MSGKDRSGIVLLAELTEKQRRACFLAERLMLIESRIAGTEDCVERSYNAAVKRAASVDFAASYLARFKIFRGILDRSTPAEVRLLRVQYRNDLAEVLGCTPDKVVATPDKVVERKMRRSSVAVAQ